jgi:hypothetical protein
LIPAALLGVVAFTLTLIITDPPGPGLDPDALAYIGAAEAVVGHGEYRIPSAKWTSADSTEPLAHFPPGYSTALALPIRLGMAPTQAARVVQATAAFVTVSTLVLLVSAAASTLAGILLALSLFAMTSMHEVHVSVLSEPLFLACMVLVLAAMVWAPDRPLRAGIPAAIGVMTRYAGVSLVGATALWALARGGTWKARARRATIAVLPALVLQAAWVLRTRAVAGSGEIRRFALYGDLKPTLVQGGATLAAWLIPDPGADREPIPYRGMLAVAAGFALLTLTAIGWWRVARAARRAAESRDSASSHERQDARAILAWRLVTAATLILVCYLGVVALSRVAADPDIPLDDRLLAPALLLLMTVAAVGLTHWWRGTRLVIARVAVASALLGWWLAAATTTALEAHYALDLGSDFAGEQWRGSEVLAWARTEGAGRTLYSNWPAAVYFHLHRPSRELPRQRDAHTLAAFADTVRVRDGRVLLFDTQSPEFAPNHSLLETRGLRTIARLRDGVVLGPVPVIPQERAPRTSVGIYCPVPELWGASLRGRMSRRCARLFELRGRAALRP